MKPRLKLRKGVERVATGTLPPSNIGLRRADLGLSSISFLNQHSKCFELSENQDFRFSALTEILRAARSLRDKFFRFLCSFILNPGFTPKATKYPFVSI